MTAQRTKPTERNVDFVRDFLPSEDWGLGREDVLLNKLAQVREEGRLVGIEQAAVCIQQQPFDGPDLFEDVHEGLVHDIRALAKESKDIDAYQQASARAKTREPKR
jgi:hypothetical protein